MKPKEGLRSRRSGLKQTHRWKTFVLCLAVLLVLFPFVFLVLLSLSTEWRFPDLLPSYFGLKNWKTILGSEAGLLQSFVSSLIISLSVATASTGAGFLISRAVFLPSPEKNIDLIGLFPLYLGPRGICGLSQFFFPKNGLVRKHYGGHRRPIYYRLPLCAVVFQ